MIGPRRRNPRTRHDVADVLDTVEHIRWCLGGDQVDRLRTELECEASSRIARQFGRSDRADQAGDLIRVAWSFRRPSEFFPDRALAPICVRFAEFYATRRAPDWALAQYAETVRMMVDHLDAEAAEVAHLITEMATVCPAALPVEDAPAVAAALADEWRTVLEATQEAYELAVAQAGGA